MQIAELFRLLMKFLIDRVTARRFEKKEEKNEKKRMKSHAKRMKRKEGKSLRPRIHDGLKII